MTITTADERDTLIRDAESARPKSSPRPFKWVPLLILLLFTLMQPLTFDIVFPFVNQMILENGITADPERVGFYSGFIESIYSCMAFIAILPFSALSDRIGRKPVIVTGMFGLALSVSCFGISKTFLIMVLSRSIGGILGGATVACTRSMIGEMTDKSTQSFAFSLSSIAYRTGQIIGLPLGGLLAHPERNFALFDSPFWYEYPFALPCFIATALCFVSVVVGCFFLEETLITKQKPKSAEEMSYGSLSDSPCPEEDPASVTFMSKYKSIMTPQIISLFITTIAMCFCSEAIFAVTPLFLFTPIPSGGLGYNEAAIGTQMGVRAVLNVIVLAFFEPLHRKLGTIRTYQLAMWMWPVCILCFPLLHWLAREFGTEGWIFPGVFALFLIIWSVGGFSWTAGSIMVNDSSPSASTLATINGVYQMMVILPQAIAPAFVTSLFAASIKSGVFGGNLVWVVLVIMTTAGAVHSMTLREPRTDWRGA